MTDYQINLTVDTYFETLIEQQISEQDVKDMYQRGGMLHIILNDEKIIKRKIKNFNN